MEKKTNYRHDFDPIDEECIYCGLKYRIFAKIWIQAGRRIRKSQKQYLVDGKWITTAPSCIPPDNIIKHAPKYVPTGRPRGRPRKES